MLRIDRNFAHLFDGLLSGLVHDSVREESSVRFRHERFLIARLATGALMLGMLPPFLVWRGVPSGLETLAIASLLLPVLAAAILSRTGHLWMAHGVSSLGLTGLVVCLAALTGGADSGAAIWLVAIPLEAVLSGSIRATVTASVLAVVGAFLIALSGHLAITGPAIGWSGGLASLLFAVTAFGHVVAQATEHLRREGAWRRRERDNEARDRVLLSAIDDLVTWHDPNGRVVQASASAHKLLGTGPASLNGHGLLHRVHVGDRPALLQAISDVAASGRAATVPFRLHLDEPRPDGTRTIFAEMRAHRMEVELAGAKGATVVAVTRDVSEHRLRTDELDRARAEAERADEVKSRFLATVTHELRTPLNAIIGFSEVLAGEGVPTLDPAQARDYAQTIAASGHHLLDVVNALLDMSRIQSGHFEFEPEPVDVAALLTGCCDMVRLKATQGGIDLVRLPVPAGLEIGADARACRQILINLISNALKHTTQGGRIEVGVRCGDNYVDLTVRDTGAGIPALDLPRIGDPFFQAAGGYDRRHEGTGLGLSVVRGLVGLHGGSIAIESTVGEGTWVAVTLPMRAARTPAGGGLAPIRASVRSLVQAAAPRPSPRQPIGLFEAMPRPEPVEPEPYRLAG